MAQGVILGAGAVDKAPGQNLARGTEILSFRRFRIPGSGAAPKPKTSHAPCAAATCNPFWKYLAYLERSG